MRFYTSRERPDCKIDSQRGYKEFIYGGLYPESELREWLGGLVDQQFQYVGDGPPAGDAVALRMAARFRGICALPWHHVGSFESLSVSDLLLPLMRDLLNSAVKRGMVDPPRLDNLKDCFEAAAVLNTLIDFDKRHEPTRNATKKKRGGRPRKEEARKNTLVIAALASHHQYESGGSVGNYTPAGVKELAKAHAPSLTDAAVSRFLKKQFGDRGHKGYVAACHPNATVGIGQWLARWQGELPTRNRDLTADEYGRGHDE